MKSRGANTPRTTSIELDGSAMIRRIAARALALAAWQRDDVDDAMRWLGGITQAVYTHSQPEAMKAAARSFTRVVTNRDNPGSW